MGAVGHGVRFDVELRRGAGAYICGEEMALLNSLEGRRGEPRNKPPFPTQAGLFGQPTVINNVETLVNVLPIVVGGGKAFAALGTERLCVLAEVDRRAQPGSAAGGGEPLDVAIRRRVREQTGLLVDEVELVAAGTIPVTTSGKIRRAQAKEIFLAAVEARASRAAPSPEGR